jgi:outer membrane protein TolC
MSGQEEPLLAEVELAHAEHRLADLKTDLLIVLAGINTLLHRDLDAPLPPFPAGLDVPAAGFADLGALRESALAARPELRRLDAQAEARAAGVALAESEYRPDFGLMGSYDTMWRETEHQWMVGLSVNLPLRRERRNAAKREAESRVSEIDAMRAETRDAVLFEVDRAYRKLHKSRHVIGLFTNRLLPASEDHLSAARSSLETGRTTFLDLIDAERNLRTTELGYEEALTDYYRARAALERATGRIPGLSGEEQ